MPVLRALVIVLALSHVVGVSDLVMDDGCGDVCTGDDCGTDCLPGTSCRCHCPSAMPYLGGVAGVATVAPDASAAPSFEAAQRAHASPDPVEILHVPKRVV